MERDISVKLCGPLCLCGERVLARNRLARNEYPLTTETQRSTEFHRDVSLNRMQRDFFSKQLSGTFVITD